MKFRKILFLSLLAISVWVNNVMARSNAPAGQYWNNSALHDCKPGCYCTGGTDDGANGNDVGAACGGDEVDDHPWLATNDAWGTLHAAGIYACEHLGGGFKYSTPPRSSKNDCYKWCDANSFVFYDEITCNDGYYLKKGNNHACSSCEKGYYCTKKENLKPSCTEDQGNIYQCGVGEGKELEYAPAGASACSTCDADGKAVVKNGELHVGCEACDAGKYTLDHQNCHDCPVGYSCQSGIRHKCTGNTYSDVEGLAECKVCSGDKMGVKYTTTTVNDQTETLQTGCDICPNGKYGNDGVCEPCTAGYRCLNGEKTICPKGYYSAAGAVSCTHCPNYFTTEGPGTAWTQGENVPCTVAHIYLKNANSSGNGIMFPACLNRGDINERVLYSN